MRVLFLFFFSAFVLSLNAQDFEGTIKWSFNNEITDPVLKQQMMSAQKKISDPQTQAKMKEMEKQMEDPQFKKMLESNPQMKEQMEKVMLAIKAGGNTESVMPKEMTVKIKNGNSISRIEGGMMTGDMLNIKGKDQTYYINRNAKTYYMIPHKNTAAEKPNIKITKTSENRKILNYNCTKYLIESTDNHHQKFTQYIWTTQDIKNMDIKSLMNSKVSYDGQSLYYEDMVGVPLRVEIKTTQANIAMEVISMKKESIDASEFVVPADFKETKGFGF